MKGSWPLNSTSLSRILPMNPFPSLLNLPIFPHLISELEPPSSLNSMIFLDSATIRRFILQLIYRRLALQTYQDSLLLDLKGYHE